MPINTEAKSKAEEFEVIALAHIDSIYAFALYMSGNEKDAQVLVFNTFLKAFTSFDKFKKGTNCKAWLLAILNDMLMNTISDDRKHLRMSHPSEKSEVFGVISGLPIRYKTVILLADMERLSYKEIADILGCPIKVVISRLCRGRRVLGRKLQNQRSVFSNQQQSAADS